MSTLEKPQLDVDQHFKEITDRWSELLRDVSPKDDQRITVMLNLPYLADYGMPEIIFPVYGCTFEVAVGDSVLCPPTPRGDGSWNTGIVVALDGSGYAGPLKYVRKISPEE